MDGGALEDVKRELDELVELRSASRWTLEHEARYHQLAATEERLLSQRGLQP
jgi:hypothetical protein